MSDYTQKGPGRGTRRRCAKCGRVGYYEKGAKKCRLLAFGRGSYACWGNLKPISTRAPTGPRTTTAGDELREMIAQAATLDPRIADAGERIRADARAKLAKAQARVTEIARDVKRLSQLLDKYVKAANYHARRASLTNEDVQAERARRGAKFNDTAVSGDAGLG